MKNALAEKPALPLDAQPESTALAMPQGDGFASMVERLACNPAVDVDKLQRLLDMQIQIMDRGAKSAFGVAMSEAQQEIRPVAADANNPQTRSKYASYEALDRAIRPIYTKHGFALSFDTGDAPGPDYVRVLCDVSHIGGHTRTYKADMPADGKGAKGGDVMTKTHAVGSAMSYGMRYLLKMIFNVAVGEDDDDGNRANQTRPEVKAPAGFDTWWDDIQAVASEGFARLNEAWTASKPEYTTHALNTNRAGVAALKAKAKKVQVEQ